MNIKKTLAAFAAAATFSVAASAEELSVAATPVPHAEILEFVKPTLAEQGVELDVKVFTDYIQPNIQVDQKRMDGRHCPCPGLPTDHPAVRRGHQCAGSADHPVGVEAAGGHQPRAGPDHRADHPRDGCGAPRLRPGGSDGCRSRGGNGTGE